MCLRPFFVGFLCKLLAVSWPAFVKPLCLLIYFEPFLRRCSNSKARIGVFRSGMQICCLQNKDETYEDIIKDLSTRKTGPICQR